MQKFTQEDDLKEITGLKSGWSLADWNELWRYRDLFYFLVKRDLKARYAQSVLGVGWAVLRPVFTMIVFTVVFGKMIKVGSDGVPYAVFSYAALVPWTYFSSSVMASSASLVTSSEIWTKVYFPRLVIPIAPILSNLVDFGIALSILGGLMVWYGITPTCWAFAFPALTLMMMCTAAGMGMWFTALSVQYRDINYGMSFFVQLLIYAAPVVYPASSVPERFRMLYGIFPMAGVIEGFRASLLGTTPMPWSLIGVGAAVSVILFMTGAWYFRRMERVFADVV